MNKKYIDIAIENARKSPQSQHHGAVMFKGGKIYSYSCNIEKHAEIECLDSLPYTRKLKDDRYNLLVIRIGGNGKLTNSKPCMLCISHLKCSKSIRYIFYSDWNGDIIKENINNIESDHISNATKNYLRCGGTIGMYKMQCHLQ